MTNKDVCKISIVACLLFAIGPSLTRPKHVVFKDNNSNEVVTNFLKGEPCFFLDGTPLPKPTAQSVKKTRLGYEAFFKAKNNTCLCLQIIDKQIFIKPVAQERCFSHVFELATR